MIVDKDLKWSLDTIDELLEFIISLHQYEGCNILTLDEITYKADRIREKRGIEK